MAVMHKNSLNCLKLVLLTLLFLGARIALAAEGNTESHQEGPTVHQCRSHIEAALKTFITTRKLEEPQSMLQDQPQTESGPPTEHEDITEKTKDETTQDETAGTEGTADEEDEVTRSDEGEELLKEGDQEESETATEEGETEDKDGTEATQADETEDTEGKTQETEDKAGEDEATEAEEAEEDEDEDETEADETITEKEGTEEEEGTEADEGTETEEGTKEETEGTKEETEEGTEAEEGTKDEETEEGTEAEEGTKDEETEEGTEAEEGTKDEETEAEDEETEAGDEETEVEGTKDETEAEDEDETEAEGTKDETEDEETEADKTKAETEAEETEDEETEADATKEETEAEDEDKTITEGAEEETAEGDEETAEEGTVEEETAEEVEGEDGTEATEAAEGTEATAETETGEETEATEKEGTAAEETEAEETEKTVAEEEEEEDEEEETEATATEVEGGKTATETEQAEGETEATEAEADETGDQPTETAEDEEPSEEEEEGDKGDDTVAESEAEDESAGEPETEEPDVDKEETEADEDEEEETAEDLSEYRSRGEHITQILGLDEEAMAKTIATEKYVHNTLKDLKKMYENAIMPMENLYKFKDISNRYVGDAELFSKPMILFIGPWSSGKSAMINYFLDTEDTRMALRTGAEPQSNGFTVLMYGETEQQMDGIEIAADWTFSSLQKFGQSFQSRLKGVKLPNNLLRKVTIVDTPGILENRKQQERTYPFNDACQWFIDRADIIYVVFDPTKLDMGLEMEALFDQLKGREAHVRIVLNKADSVKPQELMRVQSTLLWNLSPLLGSAEPPVIYVGTFWSKPYLPDAPETLFEAQEAALLEDLRQTIDGRVENKISFTRRHAVRVRNHAKMVDCYLDTYYNHKTFFSNKKKVADEIIENPQNYHIYEGLSTLTNVSRYDLPDPDIYRDFFKVNPLYEFKLLSSTCSYFKGCPLDKLDMAISYDLPELMGKYRKLTGATAHRERS